MDLKKLKEPFEASDIEWRISRAGAKNDKPWAFILAYVTNRAIMDRLDDVCGPQNWQNEYKAGPDGGIMCGLSIKYDNEWVTKWDGAENTNIDAVKGGFSGSMKRTGVQWGIGRYLYNLTETFAKIVPKQTGNSKYQAANPKKGVPAFHWEPPSLPAWALPTPEPIKADPLKIAKIKELAELKIKSDEGLFKFLDWAGPCDKYEQINPARYDEVIAALEKRPADE